MTTTQILGIAFLSVPVLLVAKVLYQGYKTRKRTKAYTEAITKANNEGNSLEAFFLLEQWDKEKGSSNTQKDNPKLFV